MDNPAARMLRMADFFIEKQVLDFISSVDVAGLPHSRRFLAEPPPAFPAQSGKDQSVLVGSQIVSFAKGVTPEKRNAIANSALLAQLAANKQVPDQTSINDWYNKYFEVLTHIGWTVQNKGFSQFATANTDVDVTEAILAVAASALGGTAATGYLLVKSALEALKPSEKNKPWVTLFERESLHANAARFQVSLVNEEPDAGFLINLMAFSLEAKTDLTQVLFFRFKSASAVFKQFSGAVTISDTLLATICAPIADRVAAYTNSYIKELPDLA
jgi:hypothetical protein